MFQRHAVGGMAEVAVPRELFAAILDRIQRFGVPPPLLQSQWPSRSSETLMIRVGHGLTLRGNGTESLSRKRQRPAWPLGAGKLARLTAAEVVIA